MNFLGNKPFFFAMLALFIIVAGTNYFTGTALLPPFGYVIIYVILGIAIIGWFTNRNKNINK